MMSLQEPLQYHFPVLEACFTPDEIQELLSMCQSGMPVQSTSSSETGENPEVSYRNHFSTEITRSVYSAEERKNRRMVSNRESARRSRLRKKRLLEDLAVEVNRLKVENQKLKNRLWLIIYDYYKVQKESDELIVESFDLQQKLEGLYQIMATMQLHCS